LLSTQQICNNRQDLKVLGGKGGVQVFKFFPKNLVVKYPIFSKLYYLK